MHPRALLVTFDAWRTLFTPRVPIAAQYSLVARRHGVDLDQAIIQEGFLQAYNSINKEFPNYGKTVGMKPGDWWTKVIRATFSPTKLPPELAPDLISHFATSAAYELYPSVPGLLHAIRFNDAYDRTVIGVVSNSDPRVWSILNSLGVAVRNYQTTPPAASNADGRDTGDSPDTAEGRNGSVDFLTLSYDVGVGKPDKRIFDAAFEKAQRVLAGCAPYEEKIEWTRVHVGDDLKKDIEAAEVAGWRAILWDGERRPEAVLKEILTDRWCHVMNSDCNGLGNLWR